ncbi:hypothetical protein ACJ73_09696 [Blastomyces percursus]|uniref:Uncharacterized protein n=1 Tax=Blastomyces percursus TaxID=1658174 RepID=A0A1J9P3S9_9EURO|nr:hypothetical protein ACJ73_09696 [Blastomyces percursus]
MFSPNTPSPSSNPISHGQPHRNSFRLPAPPAKLALPTGECRFILLHPSIPGQRCNMVNSSQVSEPASPLAQPALVALLERVSRLEEQHRHDRKLWEDELKEERRARREDARVLREAMHSFYKFMEREVPQKFAAVDDKTDSLLDHVSRLEERIGIIDDSTMGLENRVSDLEGDDDGYGDEGGHGNHEDGVENEGINEGTPAGEGERNLKRARRRGQTTHRTGAEQRVRSVKLNNDSGGWAEGDCQCYTSMAPPKLPIASQCHSAACISKSPTTSPYNPATDSSFPLDLIDAHAPNTGAHTYVHRLTSPLRDLVTPPLSNQEITSYKTIRYATNIHTTGVPLIKPPRPRSASARQDVGQKDLASQQQVSRVYPSPEEKGIGLYYEMSNPPSGKRKLDSEGQYEPETRQRPMFLPMPPPLSLPGPNVKV